MAIQKFRDMTEGFVAKIIVGLIIIVFALFGFGSITTFLAPVPKVATVNGENVTTADMEVAVERNRRLMVAQGVDPQTIDEDRLREQVLQSLISRELLTQVTEELGLYFSDASLDEEIVATPNFQIDGVFNPEQFRVVVSSVGFTPMGYRKEMRKDKTFAQLSNGIRDTAFVSDQSAQLASRLSKQTRDIAYLLLRVDTLGEQIELSEADIEAFYSENRDAYYSEERIELEYVELELADLLAEVEVDEGALEAYFADVQENYSRAESRRVAHILIEVNDDVSDEQARGRVDDIYQQIVDGGDFAALAREYSQDPGSAENGGDLGFNEAGTFVPAFEEATDALTAPNQVTEPVKTEFGYHIIKLLGVEAASVPTLDEIRPRVELAYRESLAEDIFVSRSSELDELSFEAADLQEPAETLSLTIKSTGLVSRDTEEGLLADPQVRDMAFSPDVLLDGNNSPLLELSASRHVVIRVKQHEPSELRELADVRDEVVAELTRVRASEAAQQRAEDIVAELESGSITRYVADQAGLEWTVLPGVSRFQRGLEAGIAQAAFGLPRPLENDKSVGYTTLASGDVVVLSVTNVRNPAPIEVTATEVRDTARILTQRQGMLDLSAVQDTAEQTADIKRFN